MNTQQLQHIQDSFLLFGICSNPDCAMRLSPFSTAFYTRCPICDEPAILPESLSPVLKKGSTKNIYQKYFPDFVSNLFSNILYIGDTIGNTKISFSKTISSWAGVDKLYLKEETNNPSGSFKDRGSFMAIALLEAYTKRVGMDAQFIFGTVSTGNMAISSAFWANRTGHNSFIVISKNTPGKKINAIQKAAGTNGTTLFIVDGEYSDIHEIIYRSCAALREENISVFPQLTDDVFRISGYATLFAEIVDQLIIKNEFPDFIILPIGSGALFRAAEWALRSLFVKGYIKKIPRIVLVQEIGGDPIIHAFNNNLSKIEKINVNPKTVADAIAVSNSRSGNPILRTLKEGYHLGIGVETQEIEDAMSILQHESYFPEEASCASLAAAKKLALENKIAPNSTVVCVLTGKNITKRNFSHTSVKNTIISCSLQELQNKFLETYLHKEKQNQYFSYFA